VKKIIIPILLCFFWYSGSGNAKERESMKLRILITTDMHGWLSTSLVYPNQKRKGLLHLEEFINKARRQNPDLIFLDGGDLLQGSPLVHFYNQNVDKPVQNNPFFTLVNTLRYDAIAVGNHDLEISPLFEKEYVGNSNFPWLAANVKRQGKLLFTPYKILHRQGIKIAILGFTTPGSLMWLSEGQLSGMEIEPLVESAKFWIREVERKEAPDVVIGLIHAGVNMVRDDEISKLNRIPQVNNVREVAEEVHGFHLIITGHDHRLIPSKTSQKIPRISGTPVIEGGHWAEALTDVEIKYQKKDDQFSVTSIKAKIHRAAQDAQIDREYQTSLSQEFMDFLFEPLPWIVDKTNKKEASLCFNYLNAIAQVEDKIDGALLPEISVKGIRSITGKPLKRVDLFRWFKYDNRAVIVKLSERDIELLQNPRPLFGSRSIPYNRKLFSWLKEPLHESSNHWLLSGKQLIRDKQVLISNYHMNGGGGIIPGIFVNEKNIVQHQSKLLRDKLFEFLKNPPKKSFKSCSFLQFQQS